MTVEEAVEFFRSFPKAYRPPQAPRRHRHGLHHPGTGQQHPVRRRGPAHQARLRARQGVPRQDPLHPRRAPPPASHFADVEKLIDILHRLVDAGNTVITIEHNLEIIKDADYLVDLGPEGGDKGGRVVAHGPPSKVAQDGKRSYTGPGRCESTWRRTGRGRCQGVEEFRPVWVGALRLRSADLATPVLSLTKGSGRTVMLIRFARGERISSGLSWFNRSP